MNKRLKTGSWKVQRMPKPFFTLWLFLLATLGFAMLLSANSTEITTTTEPTNVPMVASADLPVCSHVIRSFRRLTAEKGGEMSGHLSNSVSIRMYLHLVAQQHSVEEGFFSDQQYVWMEFSSNPSEGTTVILTVVEDCSWMILGFPTDEHADRLQKIIEGKPA
jgi:hypothetical protein